MVDLPPVLDLVSSWEGWWAVARAAEGVIYAGPEQTEHLPQTQQRLADLRRLAEDREGFAILQSGPVELKREFPVWGENTGNLDLMRDLKQAYDPAGVLGCGRLLTETQGHRENKVEGQAGARGG
jgi:FAD/FMN-containing dehydrogenase